MSIEFSSDPLQENDPVSSEPARSSPPWYSIILIASYSAVFATQMITGLDISIIRAGDDKDAVLQRYEIWRMLTGAALHGGVLHFAMNSYAFYSFGKLFEMLSNRAHLPIVFLSSAIVGSILSLVVNPHGISIGASGGIVGIVGYLAIYSFKRRDFITPEFRRSLIINIGIILFYGLVLSIAIDNAAHIGGLICGAVYALVQVPGDNYADPRIASPSIDVAGLVCIGIYAATCIFAILLIFAVI